MLSPINQKKHWVDEEDKVVWIPKKRKRPKLLIGTGDFGSVFGHVVGLVDKSPLHIITSPSGFLQIHHRAAK